MRHVVKIPVTRFAIAYQRVGWLSRQSKDGKYSVWVSPTDSDTWMMLPNDIHAPDYLLFQDKNILMLLYALNIPETNDSIKEITSQLKGFNYKLINRIVSKKSRDNNAVPYEVASIVPEKNVDAFRYYYQVKASNSKPIPIEKFELNHTEVGSFVIPVSVRVEDEAQTTLTAIQSDTNKVLHDYLKAVETLTQIPRKSADDFAQRTISENINSKLVKDFFGNDHSIAKYNEKYASDIKEITIGVSGSYILDFGLSASEKQFKSVNISSTRSLDVEYVEALERLEVASDDTRLEEYGARVDVLVDTVHIAGRVNFEVLKINGTKVDKPFKAVSSELTKAQLDTCADYFKDRKPATIIADITKAKGRVGKLVIESISPGKMVTSVPGQSEFQL